MRSESDLISLIAAIYEAGMDFSLWPAVLTRIAEKFDMPSAGISKQGETLFDSWGFCSGIDPDFQAKYIEYYHSVNPIWQKASSTPAGTVQTDTMVISRRELSRTEFFNDFMAPQRIGGLLNAVVWMEEGRQTVVTLQSFREFEASDVEMYKILTPHLQRAVQMNTKLAKAELNQSASLATINHLDEGVLFVDCNAKIVFANLAAERCFLNRDLRMDNGHHLHANSSAETAALHAAIAKVAAMNVSSQLNELVFLRRDLRRSPLSLQIAPLTKQTTFSPVLLLRPMVVIFVNDPDKKNKPTAVRLRERFGMTPAEAAFAVEILEGDGIQAAADRLSISRATARTHLSRIFDKTGVRRQAELVRFLISVA